MRATMIAMLAAAAIEFFSPSAVSAAPVNGAAIGEGAAAAQMIEKAQRYRRRPRRRAPITPIAPAPITPIVPMLRPATKRCTNYRRRTSSERSRTPVGSVTRLASPRRHPSGWAEIPRPPLTFGFPGIGGRLDSLFLRMRRITRTSSAAARGQAVAERPVAAPA
jgi:hypothetical protein